MLRKKENSTLRYKGIVFIQLETKFLIHTHAQKLGYKQE